MDEMTMLREHRVGQPGPSAAETAAARAALMAAIEAEPAGSPGSVRRPRRVRRRLWVPVTAAAAAGLTALGLIVSAGPAGHGRQGGSPPATLTAAYVLHQAARAAARQSPARGRYFFSESEYVDHYAVITPHHAVYHWSSPSLRRYWLGHYTDGVLEDPAAGPGPVKLRPGVPTQYGPTLSWSQVQHLPTALPPLRRVIARLTAHAPGQQRASAELTVITDLLFESPAPPALRAALYDVAATLPGVRLVRGAHDLVGRSATEVYEVGGLVHGLPGGGEALYFSPRTGAVLGWAQLSGARPQCPPLSVYAVLATGYVDSTSQVPPGTSAHLLPATYPRQVPGCAAP
jgi:hypothetical protein